MNKYVYRIKSKTTIEGDGAGEFYTLSALNSGEKKFIFRGNSCIS